MGGIMMPYMGDMGQMGYVTPNTIPNLNIWYNASSTTTVVNGVSQTNFTVGAGNQVTSWNDLSGGSHPSSAKGGSAFTTYTTNIQNGLSALQYASANNSNMDINPLTTGWNFPYTGFTFYTLARPTSLPATVFPLTVTDTEFGIWWNGTNWSVGQSTGNYGSVTLSDDTSKFHIYGFVYDGTQTGNANRLQFRYDRLGKALSFTGTIGANTGSPAYFFFGGDARAKSVNATFTGTYMNGYIGEVLIWTRALSLSEQTSVELYLNQKWGLGL